MATKTAAPARDLTAEAAFLTRALKAPTLRDCVERLAERARAEGWSHEQFLVACLQREVCARDSHGGEGRIRAARFPARKSLEDFDFDHARGLKRNLIAHFGTLDFVVAKDNILLLGPPGTGTDPSPTPSSRAGRPPNRRDLEHVFWSRIAVDRAAMSLLQPAVCRRRSERVGSASAAACRHS
jgi:hypothetical protein